MGLYTIGVHIGTCGHGSADVGRESEPRPRLGDEPCLERHESRAIAVWCFRAFQEAERSDTAPR
eukprot:5120263-Prymnesium_polylepis.1